MSEQQPALLTEFRATAQDGLTLLPATVDIAQAATYIGISKATLYTWRTRRPGFGPRAVKAGGALRYRRSDLDAWIEAHAEALNLDSELEIKTDDRAAHGSMSRRSGPRQR